MKTTIHQLADDLESGRTTARALVEHSLAAIADPAGEGARAFILVAAARARAEADTIDQLRKDGRAPSRFAGIPYGVKDLFDVAGEVTTAGSVVLKSAAPARHDADVVAKLRAQGFIAIGRTNMTEFAYSGVGLNPHYGTPRSVYGRSIGLIPGGSSSGTAVAVGEGMVPFGLGSDTGGSCRIPAAFNGVVGYKPTASRVSKRGVYPLSSSFDSIGPLANSVACCAAIDAIIAGDWDGVIAPRDVKGLRLGVLRTMVCDGLDSAVEASFQLQLSALQNAGATLADVDFDQLSRMSEFLKHGGIVAHEAYQLHAGLLASGAEAYDPRVASRLRFGAECSPDDIARIRQGRAELIAAFAKLSEGFDGILCPTVMMPPPAIAALADESEYRRLNAASLRNTYVFNFLDGCSISLPMGAGGVGLMVSLPGGSDQKLFATAEKIFRIMVNER